MTSFASQTRGINLFRGLERGIELVHVSLAIVENKAVLYEMLANSHEISYLVSHC